MEFMRRLMSPKEVFMKKLLCSSVVISFDNDRIVYIT